jgi:putative transposase
MTAERGVYLDEVFLTINGQRHYLWRAVDQDDNVFDILVQSRCNKKAAKTFFTKRLQGLQYVPRVLITDKRKRYAAAKCEVMPGVEHRQSHCRNNRCENTPRPTRQRQRRMQGFKSAGYAQLRMTAFIPSSGHLLQCRDRPLRLQIQLKGMLGIALRETEDFLKADLRQDPSAALEQAEADGKGR